MSDTSTRFRIELHGASSGLLDTISGDSMEGVRSLLIDKLERGLWNFQPGDTIRVVSTADTHRYIVAVPLRGSDKTTRAYSRTYNCFDGNWTDIIRGDDGEWRVHVEARAPQMWKTRAGAEKAISKIYSKHNLVVLRLNIE